MILMFSSLDLLLRRTKTTRMSENVNGDDGIILSLKHLRSTKPAVFFSGDSIASSLFC